MRVNSILDVNENDVEECFFLKSFSGNKNVNSLYVLMQSKAVHGKRAQFYDHLGRGGRKSARRQN